MAKMRTFAPLDPLPASWPNGLSEFISTAAPNFQVRIKPGDATVLQVPASTINGQVSIAIEAKWRYITTTVERASPGGAARTLDVFVTGTANVYIPGDISETDATVYTFDLAIVEHGATPSGVAHSRLVATAEWSGSAFTAVDQLVGPGSGTARHAATHTVGGSDPITPAAIGAAAASSAAPIGAMFDYAGSGDPAGGAYLLCDGRSLLRADYPALFSALGSTASPWGLPDGTHFKLPDFRGRVAVGAGAGTSLANRVLGAIGGEEKHQLTVAELASHSHPVLYNGTMAINAGSNWTIPYFTAPGATSTTGSDTPHENMQPFAVANKIIRAL